MNSSFVNLYRADLSNHWLKFFIWGMVLVILGIIAISATTMTTLISVIFLGSLLVVAGMVMVIDAFSFWWNKWSGFFFVLISGLIYLLFGMMLINNPIFATESLTLFIGIFYLVVGVFRAISVLFSRVPNWGWGFFSAVIAILLGVLILSSWPQSGLFIIGLFVGIDLFFAGLFYMMTSLAARSLTNNL
jgi:uncharacterized membrane protein HdeD (DUF308 family)